MPKRTDKYANVMNAVITTAGAAVATDEIMTGISLGAGRGILIDEIDYFPDATVINDFIAGAAGDNYQCSISVQSGQFGYGNSRVVHQWTQLKWKEGTPASSSMLSYPKVFQFFPPLIVAAPRIFLNGTGDASISGGKVNIRILFRYVDLSPQEYLELAESFVLTS